MALNKNYWQCNECGSLLETLAPRTGDDIDCGCEREGKFEEVSETEYRKLYARRQAFKRQPKWQKPNYDESGY